MDHPRPRRETRPRPQQQPEASLPPCSPTSRRSSPFSNSSTSTSTRDRSLPASLKGPRTQPHLLPLLLLRGTTHRSRPPLRDPFPPHPPASEPRQHCTTLKGHKPRTCHSGRAMSSPSPKSVRSSSRAALASLSPSRADLMLISGEARTDIPVLNSRSERRLAQGLAPRPDRHLPDRLRPAVLIILGRDNSSSPSDQMST